MTFPWRLVAEDDHGSVDCITIVVVEGVSERFLGKITPPPTPKVGMSYKMNFAAKSKSDK